jgi:hypothetical protein
MEDIVQDRQHIDTHYWTKIIERMYDDDDAFVLSQKIKESARNRNKQEI